MPLGWTVYDSGAAVLLAEDVDPARVAEELRARGAACGAGLVLVFTSDADLDVDALARAVEAGAPGIPVVGCTTAGELSPEGIVDGALVAILLPAARFSTSVLTIERLATTDMTGVVDAVADLRTRHRAAHGGTRADTFALCLIDGMSYSEERVTSAIFWGLEDIPLIGGSAGDSLAFASTRVIAGGSASSDRAVVVMVTTDVPFRVFKSDNFEPTETKFVVTASDPDRRAVMELNARPAALEYAEAIGCDPAELDQPIFASYPVVVRVGGEQFCRAIRGHDPETGILHFYCAIDDGVVLTLAEGRGMVDSTSRAMTALGSELGGIDFVLGFDCVYRRIDADNRQVMRKMSELYRGFNVVGFCTYGEQYHSMHLNQTLTGIAFGVRAPETSAMATPA